MNIKDISINEAIAYLDSSGYELPELQIRDAAHSLNHRAALRTVFGNGRLHKHNSTCQTSLVDYNGGKTFLRVKLTLSSSHPQEQTVYMFPLKKL